MEGELSRINTLNAPKVRRLYIPCSSPPYPSKRLADHDGISGRSWLRSFDVIRSTVEPAALGANYCSPVVLPLTCIPLDSLKLSLSVPNDTAPAKCLECTPYPQNCWSSDGLGR